MRTGRISTSDEEFELPRGRRADTPEDSAEDFWITPASNGSRKNRQQRMLAEEEKRTHGCEAGPSVEDDLV